MKKGDDRGTKKMTEMKNKIRRKMIEMKKERTRCHICMDAAKIRRQRRAK